MVGVGSAWPGWFKWRVRGDSKQPPPSQQLPFGQSASAVNHAGVEPLAALEDVAGGVPADKLHPAGGAAAQQDGSR